MLPVSAAFLAAVRSSHAIAPRVRIITPGGTGADPAGTDLRVVEGSVTLDGTAEIRGTLDLTVMEPWPTVATTADIAPYGSELAVSRGIVFGNGNVERAPLGIYRITSVEQADAPAGALRVSAVDRMGGIKDAKLTRPQQFLATATYGQVVSALIGEVYPGLPIEWDGGDTGTLGRTTTVEQDRYAFLADLATSLGKIMYFDYRGILVIRAVPSPTVPVWDIDAGAGGVLVDVGRSRTRDGVRNAVVATGDTSLDNFEPATAVVTDDDPASVTYWEGPFGKVPEHYSDPLIFTLAQATTAARGILARLKGLPYSVDFTAIANPALEPLDCVEVVYPAVLGRSPAVRRETHVIDRLTIGLNAATLTAGTRLTTTGGA